MSTELVPFDYAELDVETRIVVRQRTDEIKTLVRRSAQDIIDIGGKLIDVKETLGHGNFGGWLAAEFGWSESAAQKFMSVSARFKSVNFTEMNIGASALYLLAAPSTPEPARIEAVERAKTGERITHTVAQAIVADHKPKEDLVEKYRRLEHWLLGKGWSRTSGPAPSPSGIHKEEHHFEWDPEDAQSYFRAIRNAETRQLADDRAAKADRQPTTRTLDTALPTAAVRPLAVSEYDTLVRDTLARHLHLPTPKDVQTMIDNIDKSLAWLQSAPIRLFREATAPTIIFDDAQLIRARTRFREELQRIATHASRTAPKASDQSARPLTDTEAKVVLWRVIEHHVQTVPGAAPDYHLAAQLRWFKAAPIQLFKAALNPGVVMSDEQFVRVGAVVEGELIQRLARAKANLQPTATPSAAPRLTSLAEVVSAPDDGAPAEEWADEEEEEEDAEAGTASVEENAPLDNDEYYTPTYIVDPARQVLGTIDLDPASCASAQRVIQAEAYFTKADDGLSAPWYGTLWLNPPYSNPFPWIEKLFAEYNAGRVTAAMVLVNTANSPKWARLLWQSQGSVCLLSSRLKFWRTDKPEGKGFDRDQMIWYIGPNANKFRQVFAAYGAIR